MAKKPAEVPLTGTVTLTGSEAQAIAAGAADAKPARRAADPELSAINRMSAILLPLPLRAQARVLDFLNSRYDEAVTNAEAASKEPLYLPPAGEQS